jgi:hypothetical protein
MRQLLQQQQNITDELQQIASETQIAVDDIKISTETSGENTSNNEKPV